VGVGRESRGIQRVGKEGEQGGQKMGMRGGGGKKQKERIGGMNNRRTGRMGVGASEGIGDDGEKGGEGGGRKGGGFRRNRVAKRREGAGKDKGKNRRWGRRVTVNCGEGGRDGRKKREEWSVKWKRREKKQKNLERPKGCHGEIKSTTMY